MYITVKGIVLRVTDHNDRDAILTLLSQDRGKLTVKARGLRRKNSPLTAPCQLLAFGEFVLFEYRGSYTVNEAHSLELFHDLRRDLTKLSLCTYFAQVSEVIAQEDLPNPELQSLLLNCLYALSKLVLREELVKSVFELRVACLAGYTPDLFGCHVCGSQSPDSFDISAGIPECKKCR
jgi:DNA repair protein RecO (recombination protein O)